MFVAQQDENLKYRNSGIGPSFGCGTDIHISDCCNNNKGSYVGFPATYNRAGGNKLAGN